MLSRIGISQKIFAAFGTMILLMAVTCGAGYLGVQAVSHIFGQYRQATGQLLTASQIVQDVSALQQAALRYQRDRSDEAIKAFAATMKAQLVLKPEGAAAFAGSEAGAASFAALKDALLAYTQAFSSAKIVDQGRKATLETMTAKTDEARQTLAAVMDFARQTYNPVSVMAAADVSTNALEMLADAQRFMMSGDKNDYQAIKVHGAAAAEGAQALAGRIVDPGATTKMSAATDAIAAYLDLADQLSGQTNQRQEIEAKTLETARNTLAVQLEALTRQIVDGQAALGAEADSGTMTASTIIAAVSVLAVVLGSILALLIGRWLSGTISGIARDMGRLANGELDIELSGTERGDELGMMSGALEVFRNNGRAVREMDSLKAAEAQRSMAAQAEREAVLADVRRVVASALAGDFSGRAEIAGVPDDLRDFVTSLNNVMSGVEQGVGETAAVLDSIAEADLSRRVEGDYPGVFGRLKASTNTAADTFADIVERLLDTSRSLKTATGEMLIGSRELSERTTRQAATIEETSAAMEQLATTVTATAGKAGEAAGKSLAASALADESGQVMLKATEAMERITASSAKISSIISLIDDIAFQTNLLALNASVEAARAGEAGKGFAVVAIEVRRLAQSAAQASAEVKLLVEKSGTEVRGGSKLVADAAGRLTSILGAVRENSTLMGAISQATREQASAIAEVNAAIRTMDEMTQHNATLVEESNAAIEQAEGQARELDRIVDVFSGDEAMEPEARPQPERQPAGAVASMQARVRRAAERFGVVGNVAVDEDWGEF
ncbi:MAG: methyl-accepting chemotaxis protein [Devosia sp.]